MKENPNHVSCYSSTVEFFADVAGHCFLELVLKIRGTYVLSRRQSRKLLLFGKVELRQLISLTIHLLVVAS